MNSTFFKRFKNILPSTQFLNILVSIIIVIAIIFFAYYLSNHKESSSSGKNIKPGVNTESTADLLDLKNNVLEGDISTADLKNWQNNQQTSAILANVKINQTNTQTNTDPTTITGMVGRDMITKYLTAKSNGAILSTEEKDSLAKAVLSRDYSTLFDFTYNDYTLKDLNIVPGKPTPASAKKYFNDFNNAFTKNALGKQIDDISIIKQAVAAQDEKLIQQLNPLIEMYKKITLDLKNMAIPELISKTHLIIVNSIKRVGDDLNYIKINVGDPLIAMQAIENYHQSIVNYQKAMLVASSGKKVK